MSMDYVTDTHSLLWYFTEDPRLGKNALEAFEQTVEEDVIIIPSIVLAEIMFISKRVDINITFEETLNKIEEYDNFDVAPLDINILKVANNIDANMEMHDKLIVATAVNFNTALVTKDELIKKAGIVLTIW